MNTPKLLLTTLLIAVTGLIACQNNNNSLGNSKKNNPEFKVDSADVLSEKVLTAEQQAALTPDTILTILKTGNADFVSDALTIRNT